MNGKFYTHYLSSEAQVSTQSKQMLHLEYIRVFLDERKETTVSTRGILVLFKKLILVVPWVVDPRELLFTLPRCGSCRVHPTRHSGGFIER